MSQEFSRTRRVGVVIRRELAPLLQRLASESRWGMLTVTDVDVSPDLRQAKVYVSLIGAEPHAALLEELADRAGELRHHLARVMTTRVVPRLVFRYDETTERAARLDRLMHDPGAPDADADSGEGER